MTKKKSDFRKVNKVLAGVLRTAAIYLIHHDTELKKYCLQTAAWEGLEELKELAPELSGLFFNLVKHCLKSCEMAKRHMPEVNIRYKEYPAAAESFTELANQVDQILRSNPDLKVGVGLYNLASGRKFAELANLIQELSAPDDK